MHIKTTKLEPFGLLIEPLDGNNNIHDLDINEIQQMLADEHLLTLRGFQSFESAEDFSEYCEKHGEVCLWPFGKVLELIVRDNPEDHIFDNTYIPLHWDGMYREQVPATQVFHCVSSPGIDNGGGTTFTNTKMILEGLSEEMRKSWEKASCVYTRKMEYYDSKTVAPLLNKHPERDYDVIRYCEPPTNSDESFINHPGFELNGIPTDEVDRFIKTLNETLYAPEHLYTHRWKTGDIVFSDNHTLLHGREPFTKGAPRHLRRVQLLGQTALDNPHLIYTK